MSLGGYDWEGGGVWVEVGLEGDILNFELDDGRR